MVLKTRILAARLCAALLCAVTVVSLSMSVVPHATGGRLGIIGIEGNSLTGIPYASRVLVLPCRGRPGDYVTAWGSLDGADCGADANPTLMVKLYDGRRLVSTGSFETCSHFELRGKVVAVFPVQKLLPQLRNLSCLTAAPNFPKRTPEQQAEIQRQAVWAQHQRQQFIDSGDEAWRRLDNIVLTDDDRKALEIKLPEPSEHIGILCDCGPEAELRVCAGNKTVETIRGIERQVRPISAPVGRRLDRIVMTIRPQGPQPQRVVLVAVRRLEPKLARACGVEWR